MSTPAMKQQKSEKAAFSPMLVLLVGILAVSTSSVFIRYAQKDASSLVIAAYRLTIAALVLSPVALQRQSAEIRHLTTRKLGLLALSGFFLALHFASWITSLEYTTVISSVALVSTIPLWVALLSPLVLGERVHLILLMGLMVALLGGVVVSLGQACQLVDGQLSCPSLFDFTQGRSAWGNFLALLGAWTGAGYLMIGKRMRSSVSILTYTFLVYGAAALCLLCFVAVAGLPMVGYLPVTYIWFACLALVPQLIGHSSFNWSLKYLSATYVSVTLLGEPIGSTILAFFILKETPSSLELLGGGLILFGIYLSSRAEQPVSIEDVEATVEVV